MTDWLRLADIVAFCPYWQGIFLEVSLQGFQNKGDWTDCQAWLKLFNYTSNQELKISGTKAIQNKTSTKKWPCLKVRKVTNITKLSNLKNKSHNWGKCNLLNQLHTGYLIHLEKWTSASMRVSIQNQKVWQFCPGNKNTGHLFNPPPEFKSKMRMLWCDFLSQKRQQKAETYSVYKMNEDIK